MPAAGWAAKSKCCRMWAPSPLNMRPRKLLIISILPPSLPAKPSGWSMTFHPRPRSLTGSSPRQTRSWLDGATPPLPRKPDPRKFQFIGARRTMWPDRRIIDLFKTEFPIVLAPMAGVMDADLVIAAAQGGALGSLPGAMISAEKTREQINIIRQRVSAPVNMNFFCHKPVDADPVREAGWKARLSPYYKELGLDPAAPVNAANRAPVDEAMCVLVEELKPEVVSFHFGLPDQAMMKRIKAAGSIVLSSATIVREAIWLEENGADVIIAQGAEAGGHRGMFLTDDIAEQPGTFALVPQVVDAVKVPVIAAGGIADGRGIAAAFALGASGVQIGSAYLRCPESTHTEAGRAALAEGRDDSTVITNVMTGRPARGVQNRLMREAGPISPDAPPFPHAATALGPLKAAAEKQGKVDFTNLWAGQAVRMGREMPAAELTRALAGAALARFARMAG